MTRTRGLRLSSCARGALVALTARVALAALIAFIALAAFAALSGARAAELPARAFDLQADTLEYESAQGEYRARGRVVLREGARVLRANALDYSAQTRRGVARGDVVLEQAGDVLHAAALEFELGAEEGDALAEMVGVARAARLETAEDARVLRADALHFNAKTRRGVARGSVVLEQDGDVLRAESLEFELGAEGAALSGLVGVAREAQLTSSADEARADESGALRSDGSGGLRMSGAEFHKTGERHYRLRDARLSTCQCEEGERVPWELRALEADVELGGYATLRGARFDVFGAPLFWLPWMKAPVKRERESGLLQPTFRRAARTGFALGVPFFWAAHDNLNVVFTPHWLEKNGLLSRWEFEYAVGDRTHGNFQAEALWDDRRVAPESLATPYDDDRFAFRWRAQHALGARFTHKVDAHITSDNAYEFDFHPEGEAWREGDLEVMTALEGRFGAGARFGVSLEARVADDQSVPDNVDADERYLQRLPELRVHAGARALPGTRAHLSGVLRYTNFRRLQSAPGAAPSGQRLLVAPQLALPFSWLGRFAVLPELSWQGAFYEVSGARAERRHLLRARVETQARLHKTVALPFALGRAWHVVEPRLRYTRISKSAQTQNPLFSPRVDVLQERLRVLEADAVLRDPSDRVPPVNALTLELDQRLYHAGAQGDGVPLGALTLSAHWDFDDKARRALAADGAFQLTPLLAARASAGWNLDAREFSEALVEVAYENPRGSALALAYRRITQLPTLREFSRDAQNAPRAFPGERFEDFDANFRAVKQLDLRARWAPTTRIALHYELAWSFSRSLRLDNRFGVEYRSRCGCWSVRAEASEARTRGVEFSLRYTLLGLGRP